MENPCSCYLIDGNEPVSRALEQLERGERKILYTVSGRTLTGSITDGDVRRYLIAGGRMDAPVLEAANRSPISLVGWCETRARRLLAEKEISGIPMLNAEGEVHALVFADATVHLVWPVIHAPVIIQAGGFGTRLRPYTDILPKPLIPVGGMTITEQILRRFTKFGCSEVTLIVGHRRQLIKSYFAEADTGCKIRFVEETKPLGTGGGLYMLRNAIAFPAFVTNCDTVIEADYAEILQRHIEQRNAVTMVCARQHISLPYGVVVTGPDGAMAELREKPTFECLTNTGFYVISKEFLDIIEDETFQPMTDLIERCRDAGGRIGVYEIEGECFVDMGQMDDLHEIGEKIK